MKQNYHNEVFEARNKQKGLPFVGLSLEMETLELVSEDSPSFEESSESSWEFSLESDGG